MANMDMPGVGRFEGVTRVSAGVGYVRERTLELGATIIALENIATMLIVIHERSFVRALIGVLIALASFFTWEFGWLIFSVLMATGLGLIAWNILDRADVYLLIGTSDGRRTNIISKNRAFLLAVRDFLREKIDTQNVALIAAINVDEGRLEAPPGRRT